MNDETKMWEIIESVNWLVVCDTGTATKIRKKLMQRYTKPELDQVLKFVSLKFNALRDVINVYEENFGSLNNYGGDDSFGDLLHHIIGAGERVYYGILDEPNLAGEIDFVESFHYCIPRYRHWDYLTDNHWEREAVSTLIILRNLNPKSDIVKELIPRFTAMYNRDYKTATADFEIDIASRRGYNTGLYNRYYRFKGNNSHALFSNQLSDLYIWKVADNV